MPGHGDGNVNVENGQDRMLFKIQSQQRYQNSRRTWLDSLSEKAGWAVARLPARTPAGCGEGVRAQPLLRRQTGGHDLQSENERCILAQAAPLPNTHGCAWLLPLRSLQPARHDAPCGSKATAGVAQMAACNLSAAFCLATRSASGWLSRSRSAPGMPPCR